MEKIFIILVTYNPNLKELIVTLEKLKNIKIIICNNSSSIELKYLEKIFEKIIVLDFKKNLGIAKAQNIGIEIAIKNGAEYLIQLDQDSLLTEKEVEKLLDSYLKLEKKEKKLGAIGPIYFDKYKKFKEKKLKNKYIKKSEMISSGMFISKKIYEDVGGMKEEWFIDLIDSEFSWRLSKNGYAMYSDTNIKLPHRFGDGDIKILNFFTVRKVKPFRLYYEIRNGLYAIRLEYMPIKYKIKFLLRFISYPILILLFFPEKKERLFYIYKGIKGFIKKEEGILKYSYK